VCEERRGAGNAKGLRQGLDHEFYREREGEGVATGASWPSISITGAGGFTTFKRGLIRRRN
jgi:hypothetical protein